MQNHAAAPSPAPENLTAPPPDYRDKRNGQVITGGSTTAFSQPIFGTVVDSTLPDDDRIKQLAGPEPVPTSWNEGQAMAREILRLRRMCSDESVAELVTAAKKPLQAEVDRLRERCERAERDATTIPPGNLVAAARAFVEFTQEQPVVLSFLGINGQSHACSAPSDRLSPLHGRFWDLLHALAATLQRPTSDPFALTDRPCGLNLDGSKRTSAAVDDALDAAGAPHADERGSLTTAQRVEWLAKERAAEASYAEKEGQKAQRVVGEIRRALGIEGSRCTDTVVETERTILPAIRMLVDAAEMHSHLDLAGVPRFDERGALATGQRVEWLAGQRDKWRACSTPHANQHGPHIGERVDHDRDVRAAEWPVLVASEKRLLGEVEKIAAAVRPERDLPHPDGQFSTETTADFAVRLLGKLRQDLADARVAMRGRILNAAQEQQLLERVRAAEIEASKAKERCAAAEARARECAPDMRKGRRAWLEADSIHGEWYGQRDRRHAHRRANRVPDLEAAQGEAGRGRSGERHQGRAVERGEVLGVRLRSRRAQVDAVVTKAHERLVLQAATKAASAIAAAVREHAPRLKSPTMRQREVSMLADLPESVWDGALDSAIAVLVADMHENGGAPFWFGSLPVLPASVCFVVGPLNPGGVEGGVCVRAWIRLGQDGRRLVIDWVGDDPCWAPGSPIASPPG